MKYELVMLFFLLQIILRSVVNTSKADPLSTSRIDHFFCWWFWIITTYVYMSKCRQFKGLSTGMVRTIPNHTIKLQLDQPRHLIIKKRSDN